MTFLDELATPGTTPAGGAAAAYAGAMGAALVEMTAGDPRARELRDELRALVDSDAAAYRAYLAGRDGKALREATRVPTRIAETCARVAALAAAALPGLAAGLASDCRAGMCLAVAAREMAADAVRTNLAGIRDQAFSSEIRTRLDAAFSA